MSASPMARQVTGNQSIPTKRVLITDPLDMPADYSSTPGGTLYSTTPGGTKIVYDRSYLMNLRNSPISRTPPKWDIPENLVRGSPNTKPPSVGRNSPKKPRSPLISVTNEDDQFHMDM